MSEQNAVDVLASRHLKSAAINTLVTFTVVVAFGAFLQSIHMTPEPKRISEFLDSWKLVVAGFAELMLLMILAKRLNRQKALMWIGNLWLAAEANFATGLGFNLAMAAGALFVGAHQDGGESSFTWYGVSASAASIFMYAIVAIHKHEVLKLGLLGLMKKTLSDWPKVAKILHLNSNPA